jgi:plastocyanin
MNKSLGIIVIVLIVIAGGWYLWSQSNGGEMTGGAPQGVTGTPSTSGDVTVTYTDSGFSPASVSIKKGQSVTWVDQRANPMWLASDPHPSHTGYDGTSRTEHCAAGYAGPTPLDECGTGTSYSFTFNTAGTFGYHDHFDDAMAGSVTVTE